MSTSAKNQKWYHQYTRKQSISQAATLGIKKKDSEIFIFIIFHFVITCNIISVAMLLNSAETS